MSVVDLTNECHEIDARVPEPGPQDTLRCGMHCCGNLSPAFFEGIEAEADQLGRHIRQACRAMPDPEPLAIFENVYAEPNALLQSERQQYAAYLDSFTGEEAPR